MSEATSTPSHAGMLKTIAAAFITIIVFIGLALFWFKESPTTTLKSAPSSQPYTSSLPSLSYNDDKNIDPTRSEKVALNKQPIPQKALPLPQPLPKTKNSKILPAEDKAAQGLDTFFAQLDSTPYYQHAFPSTKSKGHFTILIQRVLDNPPVISGEADDLFTLLKNTAHFFRILGPQNITLTKKILSDNKNDIEQLASNLYLVLNNKEVLARDYHINAASKSLYNYGCFFLNTMGGRLYMFRRDLEMRMLLSYYSLLFVYYAEIAGENHNGVDVRPFLKTLIYEIENYGQNLKLRDIYLARLYNLENSLN